MDNVSATLMAYVMLHKFIIEQDGPFKNTESSTIIDRMNKMQITPNTMTPFGMAYLPVIPNESFQDIPCVLYTNLQEGEIGRLLHNTRRRGQESEDERAKVGYNFKSVLECNRESVKP